MTRLITIDQIEEVFNPSKKQVFEFQQSVVTSKLIRCPINFSYLYTALSKRPEYKYTEHFIIIFSSMKEVFVHLAKLASCKVYVTYRKDEDLSKFIKNPVLQSIRLNYKLGYLVKLIL